MDESLYACISCFISHDVNISKERFEVLYFRQPHPLGNMFESRQKYVYVGKKKRGKKKAKKKKYTGEINRCMLGVRGERKCIQ